MDGDRAVIANFVQTREDRVVVDAAGIVDLNEVEGDRTTTPGRQRDLAAGFDLLVLKIDVEDPRSEPLDRVRSVVLPADF